jgi:pyridoxal phosphate enzyme (YggS family)
VFTTVIQSRAELEENLGRIRGRIVAACRRSGRDPDGVRLVAATKTVPPQPIGWALELGIEDFGENYVQELVAKHTALGGGRWHYVGTLQSHTAARVADHADVVHSLVPGRAAGRLARRARRRPAPLPALVQVDMAGGRHGVGEDEVPEAVAEASSLEGIEVTGLTILPPPPAGAEDSRPYFRRLRELRDGLARQHPGLRELSMGMSDDYEVAVEEGASMVRIGTALFGSRPSAPTG